MEEIQSWWEVVSIFHFCSVFRAAFNLLHFDIEDLEASLLADEETGGSCLLEELIIRFLQGCLQRADITEENWEENLRILLEERWVKKRGHKNPLPYPGSKFSYLPLRTKVEILHSLCEYRLDADDVNDMIKGLEADGLRIQPIGKDGDGNSYWYFYGTRLYLEEPLLANPRNNHSPFGRQGNSDKKMKHNKKKNKRDHEDSLHKGRHRHKGGIAEGDSKSHWSLICSTESDWEALTMKFRKSKITCERKLYAVLENEYLPEIKNLFSSKERRLKKKQHFEITLPRRSSIRLGKMRSKREEEERLAALMEEAEQEKKKREEMKRKLEEEQERKKQECLERARRAQERNRNVEERNKRLRLEEEAFQQDSDAFNSCKDDNDIVEHHSNLSSVNSCADADSDDGDDLEELNQRIAKVLGAVNAHKDSWPFLQPVDEAYAPGYFEWIKEPMDLSTMDQKVQKREYHTTDEFVRDFKKMINNCEIYNGPHHAFTKIAHVLWRIFRRAVRKHLFHEVGEDESTVFVHKINDSEIPDTGITMNSVVDRKPKKVTMKKKKKKKKRRRPPGMKAIEALAQAAEQALRDAASRSSFDSSPPGSYRDDFSNSAFPNLKISTTQSHPASLLAKYFGSSRSENTGNSDDAVTSTTSTPEKLHTIGAVSNCTDASSFFHLVTGSEAIALDEEEMDATNDMAAKKNNAEKAGNNGCQSLKLSLTDANSSQDKNSDSESSSSSQSDSSDTSESSDNESSHAQYMIVPLNNGNGKLGSFQIKRISSPMHGGDKHGIAVQDCAAQRLSPDSVLSPTSCLVPNGDSPLMITASSGSQFLDSAALSSCTKQILNSPHEQVYLVNGDKAMDLQSEVSGLGKSPKPSGTPSFQACFEKQCHAEGESNVQKQITCTDAWPGKGSTLPSEVRSEFGSYHRSTESTIPVKKRFYAPDSFSSPPRSANEITSQLQNYTTAVQTPSPFDPIAMPSFVLNAALSPISDASSPGHTEDLDPGTPPSLTLNCNSEAKDDEAENEKPNQGDSSNPVPFKEKSSSSLLPDHLISHNYNPLLYQPYLSRDPAILPLNMNLQSPHLHKGGHQYSLNFTNPSSSVPSDATKCADSENASNAQNQSSNALLDKMGSPPRSHFDAAVNFSSKVFPYPPPSLAALKNYSETDYAKMARYSLPYTPPHRNFIPGTESHLSDFVSHILKKNFPSEPLVSGLQMPTQTDSSSSSSDHGKPYWKISKAREMQSMSNNAVSPYQESNASQSSSVHFDGRYPVHSMPHLPPAVSSVPSQSHPVFSPSSYSTSSSYPLPLSRSSSYSQSSPNQTKESS